MKNVLNNKNGSRTITVQDEIYQSQSDGAEMRIKTKQKNHVCPCICFCIPYLLKYIAAFYMY